MKIYIVCKDDYDGTEICGVYSSREKAVEALDYFNLDEDDIKEHEVDFTNETEKYEEFHYCEMQENGKKQFYCCKNLPSKTVPFKWNNGSINITTPLDWTASGKTKQEADANAEKAKLEFHPVWQINGNGHQFHHSHPSMVCNWDDIDGQHGFYAVHEDRNVCIIALEEYKKTGKKSEFLTFY